MLKIALATSVFPPSLGGMETVADLLAHGLASQGHGVVVLTETEDRLASDGSAGFPVLRRASMAERRGVMARSDVVLLHGLSARFGLLALTSGRPFILSHHIWRRGDQHGSWRERWRDLMERALIKQAAVNVSVSRSIREKGPAVGRLLPNPYDDSVFVRRNADPRGESVIFVGRLVRGKGPWDLVAAVARLRAEGSDCRLTIVGEGPERSDLETLANGDCRAFLRVSGPLFGVELADEMNRHHVLAVPSIWNEPFGVVALEGAACGCVIVGSRGGGLPEAIGPCGLTFRNGDVDDLTAKLAESLTMEYPAAAAASHLQRHTPRVVTRAYAQLFEEVLGAGG